MLNNEMHLLLIRGCMGVWHVSNKDMLSLRAWFSLVLASMLA